MSPSIATASYYVYSLRLTPPTLYDPYLMYSLSVCVCPSACVCLHLCLSACRSIDEIPCDASLSRQRRPWFAGDMLNLRPDDNVVVGVVVVGDCDDKHDSLSSCSEFFQRPPISFVRFDAVDIYHAPSLCPKSFRLCLDVIFLLTLFNLCRCPRIDLYLFFQQTWLRLSIQLPCYLTSYMGVCQREMILWVVLLLDKQIQSTMKVVPPWLAFHPMVQVGTNFRLSRLIRIWRIIP